MANNREARTSGWTRREALGELGTSVGLSFASEVLGAAGASQATVPSGAPRFPAGAVIRALLSDLPPAKVGPGAVLGNGIAPRPLAAQARLEIAPTLLSVGVD